MGDSREQADIGGGRWSGVVAIVLAALAGTGCEGKAATEGPADALTFCVALHALEADRLVACSSGVKAPLAALFAEAWLCDGVTHAIAAGSARYDRGQAGACLDWLRNLPCGHSLQQPYSAGPCERTLVGQVPDGEACSILDDTLELSECARTSRCDISQTCPGICRPRTKVGAACDFVTPCERGSLCTALQTGQPKTCRPVAAEGQSCDVGYGLPLTLTSQPFPVGSADSCVEGYHCDPARAVCVKDDALDPCRRGERFCVNGYCAQEATAIDAGDATFAVRDVCRPLPKPGDYCVDLPRSGATYYCPAGSRCVASSTDATASVCVAQAAPGEPCDASRPCVDGAVCGSRGTCEERMFRAGVVCRYNLPCGRVGENCCLCPSCATQPFTCAPGATCDLTSQTCLPSP